MSRGLWAKIGFLALATVVFIVIIGIIASIAYGDIEQMAPWVWWKTIMTSLGKGTPGQNDGPPLFVAIMLVAMVYGMFLSSILIGFISGSIRDKVNSLMKGTGSVIESGHTLILGFNEAAFVLLEELIEANRNCSSKQTVVVLGDSSKEQMDDAFITRFGRQRQHPKTRIISRTGSPYDLASLRRCAIESCRSVIINGADDFETTKTIMACTHLLNTEALSSEAFSVAVIYEGSNIDAARIAGCDGRAGDRLELLSLVEVLAKIIVHTSRQPGLSQAYVELFNFAGNEFYVVADDPAFAGLHGLTVAQINLLLKEGIAVGVLDPENGVMLQDPTATVFEPGQSLIVVEQDDEPLRVLGQAAEPLSLEAPDEHLPVPVRCLVIGNQPILRNVLIEYGRYLPAGSQISVLVEKDSEDVLDSRIAAVLEKRQISVDVVEKRLLNRSAVFAVLDASDPDCVVVLNDHCSPDAFAEDEKTIALLLYLRDYRNINGKSFSITSEMLLGTNMEIASATSLDDFIIGRHIAALLMAQISQNRAMREFFEGLLSNEGFEVYLKRASSYVPMGTQIDLFTAIDAVSKRKEVLIGIHRHGATRTSELMINPPKYSRSGQLLSYTFEQDDFFVVLSETM